MSDPEDSRLLHLAHRAQVVASGDLELVVEARPQVLEGRGAALLPCGIGWGDELLDEMRGLELLRKAAGTLVRISSQWPQKIDYRFALIRALNALGDALPVPESSEFHRKAYRAAGSIPADARNVRDLMNQAEVNLRWPRWNASAPVADRQRTLEIAMRALQTLLSYAPDNRSLQGALADVRRSLAGLSRE